MVMLCASCAGISSTRYFQVATTLQQKIWLANRNVGEAINTAAATVQATICYNVSYNSTKHSITQPWLTHRVIQYVTVCHTYTLPDLPGLRHSSIIDRLATTGLQEHGVQGVVWATPSTALAAGEELHSGVDGHFRPGHSWTMMIIYIIYIYIY